MLLLLLLSDSYYYGAWFWSHADFRSQNACAGLGVELCTGNVCWRCSEVQHFSLLTLDSFAFTEGSGSVAPLVPPPIVTGSRNAAVVRGTHHDIKNGDSGAAELAESACSFADGRHSCAQLALLSSKNVLCILLVSITPKILYNTIAFSRNRWGQNLPKLQRSKGLLSFDLQVASCGVTWPDIADLPRGFIWVWLFGYQKSAHLADKPEWLSSWDLKGGQCL